MGSQGYPVQNVEGRPVIGETDRKTCQPGCANIYSEANLRCTQLNYAIPKVQWCCNNQSANTELQQCSSLNEETGDDQEDDVSSGAQDGSNDDPMEEDENNNEEL